MRGRRLAGARASHSTCQSESSPLGFEPLEEITLLSGGGWETDYTAWASQTYSIDGLDGYSFTTDELVSLANPGAAVQADPALQLIHADTAQATYGYSGAGYSVAVLDTGIDYRHPALAGNYLGGWDFVDNDADPLDLNGHGTHVSGIIASASGSLYAGVAPGAKIIALRVLDAGGSGSFGNVERALQWVAQHQQQYNIVAVNMSLGAGNFTSNPWQFLEDELQTLEARGVFIAAAAGNSYSTYGSQQGLGYPAISNYTVSVGAVWSANYGAVNFASGAKDFATAADRLASFSQRSAALDILAPGAFITSTAKGGGWTRMAGTSMAAPVAAGAAVLIHQALDARGLGNLATQSYILNLMQDSGVTVVDGDDERDNVTNSWLSFKRLDVATALAAVTQLGGGNTGGNTGGNNGGGTPVATNPGTIAAGPNGNFVRALYQQLLGRDPDNAGLAYWTQQIAGGMSRTLVARSLWNSPEFRGKQVDSAYSDILGRVPNVAERNYWVNALIGGADDIELLRTLVNSADYVAVYSTIGGFVDAAYQDLLGRAAESSGRNYWISFLSTGGTRSQFVQTLVTSAEYRLNKIDGYYQGFLGRNAGQSERTWWLNQVNSGATALRSIGESFLGSDEYFRRAQSLASSVYQTGVAGARSVVHPAHVDFSNADALMRAETATLSFSRARQQLAAQTASIITTSEAAERWQSMERVRAAELATYSNVDAGTSMTDEPILIDAALENSDVADAAPSAIERIAVPESVDVALSDRVFQGLA